MEIFTPQLWAEQQFGNCELGDARRTRRLVKFGEQICHNPSQNTPMQTETWGDCKAAYRLLSCPEVTFEAVTSPHYQLTREQSPAICLLLNDTTEIDFGYESKVTGLGSVGNGSCGFLMHNSLAVTTSGHVIGLMGQSLRHRKLAPVKEKRMARLNRDRESLLWGQLAEQVGRPPEGIQWINVCDRGADDFEFFCRMIQQQQDWVVRVQHLKRKVLHEDQTMPLESQLQQFPFQELQYELTYRSAQHGTRTAKMQIRYGTVSLNQPSQRSPWLKAQAIGSLDMSLVETVEINPPAGVKPLRWVLYTSLPVTSYQEAWTVIEYYEKRWIVEEYHKALKTGCRVEERQYRTGKKQEAIAGILSIVAVRLLQLRAESKANPERPAKQVIPQIWLAAMKALRPRFPIETVGQFYRQLAGLGGHLLRKSDGDPGWITIWRGFTQLHTAVIAISNHYNCG